MPANAEQLPMGQTDPTLLGPTHIEDPVELRNQAVEAILNPDGTLPKVELHDRPDLALRDHQHATTMQDQDSTSFYDNHNYAVRDSAGTHLGRTLVHASVKTDKTPVVQIDAVDISGHKGHGYGKALYLELLKSLLAGTELTCDPRGVSKDAIKIWQWLEAKGLAHRPRATGEPVLSDRDNYIELGYVTRLNELSSLVAAK